MKPEGMRKNQEAITDGQQTECASTLDNIPEGIDRSGGKWENEQEVIDTLWERMEWFLLTVMPKKYEELPSTILTILLARDFEKGDGSWYEPNLTHHKVGGKCERFLADFDPYLLSIPKRIHRICCLYPTFW